MMRIPRKQPKRFGESTIPLINIVFLMLIFFLVAGTLTKPIDQEVELVSLIEEQNAPPPDMVFIRENGALSWQGENADIATVRSLWAESQEGNNTIMRVAADRNLPAITLLEKLGELKAVGAEEIVLITQRENK